MIIRCCCSSKEDIDRENRFKKSKKMMNLKKYISLSITKRNSVSIDLSVIPLKRGMKLSEVNRYLPLYKH